MLCLLKLISLELDGDAANDVLDSKSIKFGTDDLGTVTFAGHGGSSAQSAMDDKTPNAYEEVWDGVTGADTDVIGGHGGNNLLRYDSPSFAGVTAHASYQDALPLVGCESDKSSVLKRSIISW